MTSKTSYARRARLAAALLAASLLMTGCAALLIGGAVAGGTMVASDRRTTGAQVEDQTIEVKAGNAIGALLGDRGHVIVTSYNRMVLLTGEVPTEADKAAVEKAIAQQENVRSTVNDLAVMPTSALSSRSNDSILTGRVKAAFVDTKDLSVNTIKVVTERAVVYLMGLVTEAEARRAVEVTRSKGGVQKVVRVFEIISPAAASSPLPSATASAPATARP